MQDRSCRIFEVTTKCSGGSTSGLWQHMQRIHEKEHQELKSKSVKQSTNKVQAIKQPTLTSMLASLEEESEESEEADDVEMSEQSDFD